MPATDPNCYTDRSWYANYGVSKVTAIILFYHTSMYPQYNIKFEHILWLLYFLKVYPSYDACSVHWNVDSKTFQHWIWKTAFLFASTLNTVCIISILL